MYTYHQCGGIRDLRRCQNVLRRRLHKVVRGLDHHHHHHHLYSKYSPHLTPPDYGCDNHHVRSVTTSSTSDTEYTHLSHKLLTVERYDDRNGPPKMIPQDKLVFGQQFTPHMLQIQYSHHQWSAPKIVPYQNLSVSPAASSLHYGMFISFFVICLVRL